MIFCNTGAYPKYLIVKANLSCIGCCPISLSHTVFVISWCILFCGLSHHNHKRNLIPEALRLGEFNKLPKNKKASNKEKKKTLTVCIL